MLLFLSFRKPQTGMKKEVVQLRARPGERVTESHCCPVPAAGEGASVLKGAPGRTHDIP